MRRKQTNQNLAKVHTVLSVGDSQVDLAGAATYGVPGYDAWSPSLGRRLESMGCLTESRTFGRSGDTTAQIIGRAAQFFYFDKPSLAVLYCGVNDPGSSTSGTATAGTSTTITLASGASSLLNSYVGYTINITGGTGSGQSNTIIGYSTGRVATVLNTWSVNPNATSVYTVTAPSSAVMQANHQALIKILKFAVTGNENGGLVSVWQPSNLPADGALGQRYLVYSDNASTSGVAKNHESQHNNIAGDYSASPKQSVWEFRCGKAGVAGWGRVAIESTATFDEGVDKIICLGTNYLNFPDGNNGDNQSTSTYNSGNLSVRQAVQAACTAEGAVYGNLFDFQSKLITGGTFRGLSLSSETTQGSGEFHYIPTNQHHSLYGHGTVERCALQNIVAEGWISDLSTP